MANWREKSVDGNRLGELEAIGYPKLVARLLALRGQTAESVGRYLGPSIRDLASPFGLKGVDKAAECILGNLENIVVFGDYDCDGISATAIMARALNALKPGCAKTFIPERHSEGYGMNGASVERMLRENPAVKMVITVDNGIGALEYVKRLKEKGIKVVVTDHHLPGEDLAELECTADALVNPKVSATEELKELCGAGVAFMLANALIGTARERGLYAGPKIGESLLVMAGIATVTDIMMLTGQNRILVAEALKRFRTSAPVGLRELYARAARTSAAGLTCKDFGFLIGPRINAAGRMASGSMALELMMEQDRDKASRMAYEVDKLNTFRKQVEGAMTEEALGQVKEGAAAQVIELKSGEKERQGVAGIVAARIMEKLKTGPVAITVNGHGSCRAPEGFNVHAALTAAAESLESFGGHSLAGGFTVKEGAMENFRAKFEEAAAKQAAELKAAGMAPDTVWYDAEVEGRELTLELADAIKKMAPFGEGNEEPVFRISNAYLSNVRTLGAEGKHLAVEFKDVRMPRAVWWNHGDKLEELRANSAHQVDVLCTLEVSDYGTRHVELRLSGMAMSENF